MSRPLDRDCKLPTRGKVDEAFGEFWVDNPFDMPQKGHNLSAYERNRLFLNHHGTGFSDASFFSTADIDSDSRSVVAADFNRDGRLDILVGSVGGGPLRLFLNEIKTTGSHIEVDLKFKSGTRSATGSRVVITTDAGTITRDIFPQNGCMGQGPAGTLFGLGAAKELRSIRVRWPDGTSTTHTGGQLNSKITLTDSAADTPASGSVAGSAPRG